MQVLQVKQQGEISNAPNFRSVNTGSCYHCKLLVYGKDKQWLCNKHNILFGYGDTEDGIANQAEFVCDDFEEM